MIFFSLIHQKKKKKKKKIKKKQTQTHTHTHTNVRILLRDIAKIEQLIANSLA